MTVAALYVDLGGPYPHIFDVQCYGLPWRDARRYEGPWPVVAHPPCGPWGRLRGQSKRQDATCGPRAFEQVRAFGGVLEHPDHSALWKHVGAPKPGEAPDSYGGWSLQVEQVWWGHPCVKATWLYFVGVDRRLAMAGVDAARSLGLVPTRAIDGGPNDRSGRSGVSHQWRRRSPPAFAAWLVALARSVRAGERAA